MDRNLRCLQRPCPWYGDSESPFPGGKAPDSDRSGTRQLLDAEMMEVRTQAARASKY